MTQRPDVTVAEFANISHMRTEQELWVEYYVETCDGWWRIDFIAWSDTRYVINSMTLAMKYRLLELIYVYLPVNLLIQLDKCMCHQYTGHD